MITHSEENIVRGILKNGVKILEMTNPDIDTLEKYSLKIDFERLFDYPLPNVESEGEWLIPDEYKTFDISNWVLERAGSSIQEQNRARLELKLFEDKNMINVLRAMKYIVDTMRKHNILWGVGRGSSTASYVLYIIGVHKIDPIKYDLPVSEFFKEIQNG